MRRTGGWQDKEESKREESEQGTGYQRHEKSYDSQMNSDNNGQGDREPPFGCGGNLDLRARWGIATVTRSSVRGGRG